MLSASTLPPALTDTKAKLGLAARSTRTVYVLTELDPELDAVTSVFTCGERYISLEQGVYGFYLRTYGGSGFLWCLCGNDMVNGTALV